MKFRFRKHSGSSGSQGAGFRGGSNSKGGRVVLFLFGIPFFGMGFFFCWMGAISPILKSVASNDWPEVPCTIAVSEVESHSGSDGATYSVNIEFSYLYGTENYTGGSYNFNKFNSSGYDGKKEIVDQYPVGSEAVCFVNPDVPKEAILTRSIPGIVFFIIPFTSIFMLVGLGAMLSALGLLPKKWKDKVQTRHKPVESAGEGAATLKPEVGGLGKLLGMLAVCLFWNGIVSIFLWQVVESFQKGNPEWFLTVFMIPFVVIGLGMIWGVIYFLLALRNPSLSFSMSEARPSLGEQVQLNWKASKPLRSVEKLSIFVEGLESATYTRGTDSVTDKCIFHRTTLFESDAPATQHSGELELTIPEDSMHSFDGGNNKIQWRLRVDGSIRRWPDISQNYPFTVRPRT